ncbi:MAG TPA: LptA/OstA family protein [Polyangiaceae bacterium]|jgi:lipopolysaccharide export system protein LptA|nr:LptA/OstA family protein [Polyangiaceae bacterium]
MLLARRNIGLVACIAFAGVFGMFGDGLTARAAPIAVIEGRALDVSAERLDIDVEHGTAHLEGNVVARLGELEVRCPTVELSYDESPRVKWARARGGVTARFKGIEATSSAAELDAHNRSVVLTGGVRLSRGKGWITAEQATVDVASGKVSLQEVKGSIPVDAVHQ